MFSLSDKSVKENKAEYEKAGIHVPSFDRAALQARTAKDPVWVHIGSGNLFKGFHCVLQQHLVEQHVSDKGIIVVEPFDYEIISKIYQPCDNLNLQVVMKANGELDKQVISAITEAIAADSANTESWSRLKEIFSAPSLQMVTVTITEKGHDLRGIDGAFRKEVLAELDAGYAKPIHAMAKLAALMFERYKNGKHSIALVSTDNFSHNGDKLKTAVVTVAEEWKKRGHVEQGFIDYLSDDKKVSFPWSMIDKITPQPSPIVKAQLEKIGFGSAEITKTSKNSVVAPFVNTEEAQYLVIEDKFPNGRPALEKAGVYFTDRQTVDKVERMKVCTCLNPLHTALAIFGCLLGYTSIAAEMKDKDLTALIDKIGYIEGMPVVTDPGIIKPQDFIKEVMTVRFPNPNIPDTPQRIASDTSQKLGIRFGETIKSYLGNPKLDVKTLRCIPLVIAAWCRYLIGLDDESKEFAISPDPLLANMQEYLKSVKLGSPDSVGESLKPILTNTKIFGIDLYTAGLGLQIESYFKEMLAGKGAVRNTLHKYVS